MPISPGRRPRKLRNEGVGISPDGGKEGETTVDEGEGRETGVDFGEEEEEKKEEVPQSKPAN